VPRRDDITSILIIGSGPIVIGQAAEFDYSGTQGARALRAEGYRVVLVNSNPATIMTDPSVADATYVEPLDPEAVEAVGDGAAELGVVAGRGPSLATEREAGADYEGKANLPGQFFCLGEALHGAARRDLQADPLHGLRKKLAIFGHLDRSYLGTEELHVQFVEDA